MKKNQLLLSIQSKTPVIQELNFDNCFIPLDKLWYIILLMILFFKKKTEFKFESNLCFSTRTQHIIIPLVSASTSSTIDDIFLKSRHISPTISTRSSSPTLSSRYYVRSPLNLVEDEQSSTSTIIMFQEDTKR